MTESVIPVVEHDEPTESTLFGMRTAISELPKTVVWLRLLTVIAAVFLLVASLVYRTPIGWSHVWLFALALFVTEYLISLETAPGARLHLGYTFLILYFQLVGGVAAAVMYAGVRFVEWLVGRFVFNSRSPFLSGVFDVAVHFISALSAAWIAQTVLGFPMLAFSSGLRPVAVMAVFAGAFLLVHTLITSIAVYARYGFSDVRTQLWPTTMLWMAISLFVSTPFALVASYLSQSLDVVRGVGIIFALVAVVSAIAKLNARLRRTNEVLRTVNEIGNAVNATLSRQELRSVVARETSSLLRWDRFYFATPSDEPDRMTLIFLDKNGNEVATTQTPAGIGMTGQAMATGELVHYEREVKVRDPRLTDAEASIGSTRPPRSLLAVPLTFGDERLGVIGFQSRSRDAFGPGDFLIVQMIASQTAIALRNSQLYESEERANRERDEFLGIVTHEIKSPLTSVGGYSDLAKASIEDGDLEGAIESLGVVKTESAKILRLVEDLLDASKMDGGRFSVEMGEVDVTSIVRSTVERFERTTDHVMIFNVEDEIPQIQGDEQRLSQVVENLVSNAVKYSPGGRQIVVTLRRTSESVELLVSDQGDGIPPEKLPHVFDRFFRVYEGGGDSAPKGTGLGLYITRQIVKTHGGSIDVESEVGVGTSFLVSLPLESGS